MGHGIILCRGCNDSGMCDRDKSGNVGFATGGMVERDSELVIVVGVSVLRMDRVYALTWTMGVMVPDSWARLSASAMFSLPGLGIRVYMNSCSTRSQR